MAPLTKLLILLSGLAVTAFSLERTRVHGAATAKITNVRKASVPALQHSSHSLLSALEGTASSVASAPAPESKSFVSTIWN